MNTNNNKKNNNKKVLVVIHTHTHTHTHIINIFLQFLPLYFAQYFARSPFHLISGAATTSGSRATDGRRLISHSRYYIVIINEVVIDHAIRLRGSAAAD